MPHADAASDAPNATLPYAGCLVAVGDSITQGFRDAVTWRYPLWKSLLVDGFLRIALALGQRRSSLHG